jgi:hypothetical protein
VKIVAICAVAALAFAAPADAQMIPDWLPQCPEVLSDPGDGPACYVLPDASYAWPPKEPPPPPPPPPPDSFRVSTAYVPTLPRPMSPEHRCARTKKGLKIHRAHGHRVRLCRR